MCQFYTLRAGEVNTLSRSAIRKRYAHYRGPSIGQTYHLEGVEQTFQQ